MEEFKYDECASSGVAQQLRSASPVLRALAEHGIGNVVPGNDVLERHARQVMTRAPTNKALEAIRAKAEEDAASIALSSDLRRQVVAALRRQPDIPWDLAVADLARKALNRVGEP